MKDFEGKVAVVTGGASGIGLGMARAFGRAGMKLVIADLDDAAMTAAEEEFGAQGVDLVTARCDVSDHAQIQALRSGSARRGRTKFCLAVVRRFLASPPEYGSSRVSKPTCFRLSTTGAR